MSPRPGTTVARILEMFDQGQTTSLISIDLNVGSSHIHYALNRYRPGWKASIVRKPKSRVRRMLWNGKRTYGNSLTRFRAIATDEPTSRYMAALDNDHPAMQENRTIFRSRVFYAGDRDRALISGINNSKIGKQVTVGPWAGFPIYTLSLEERATCPSSCPVLAECYGNGMPMAVRFRYTPGLIASLDGELNRLSARHPRGYVVRLHVLGDFPDVEYLSHWLAWSNEHPALHVWGFTAHPQESAIGGMIRLANGMRPDRWMIRFSSHPDAPYSPMQVHTTWEKPGRYAYAPETNQLVCPRNSGRPLRVGRAGSVGRQNLPMCASYSWGTGKSGQRKVNIMTNETDREIEVIGTAFTALKTLPDARAKQRAFNYLLSALLEDERKRYTAATGAPIREPIWFCLRGDPYQLFMEKGDILDYIYESHFEPIEVNRVAIMDQNFVVLVPIAGADDYPDGEELQWFKTREEAEAFCENAKKLLT